jgi:uncharacterized membrane protein
MMESSTVSRANFAAIPLALLLAACGTPKDAVPPVEHGATDSGDDSSSKIPMRGIATVSGPVTTVHECGATSTSAMTVSDPSRALAGAFASLAAKPAEGLYVELDGAPSADGKTFDVTALRLARTAGNSAPCDQPVFEGEFAANGNEPFWAIEIRENGIVYSDPSNPKGRVYPYAFTRTETGSVVYATKIVKPAVSTLEITLEPSRCVDSMSGEIRSLKAHVALDGRKLEGCARAGVPHGEFGNAPLDELNRFAGTYPKTVNLWKEPVVEKRLEALLGTAMPAFVETMKVQSPLMKDSGVFYVTGNKPHQGGQDGAVFLADPATDTIGAILFAHGTRQNFKEGGRDIALPADLAAMVAAMNTP